MASSFLIFSQKGVSVNLRVVAHNGWNLCKRNAPTILTGIGLGGLVVTAFFAGRGSLEADRVLQELEAENGPLEFKDKVKATYKYYLPAIGTGIIAAVAIIGANRFSTKQIAAITTAAKITEQSLVDNREAIEKVFGEKGLRKVDEAVNEERAVRYFANTTTVHDTGKGTVLCCEGFLTGMLFRASREWVRKTVNEFNLRLIAGERLSDNEFIMMLIPDVDLNVLPDSGDMFGYNLDIKRQMLEIVEDSFLTQDSREPGYIFKLAEMPLMNYDLYV